MSQDGVAVELTHVYTSSKGLRWVTTGSYGKFDGDKVNPLFDKKNDADRYFFASTLFIRGGFGLDKWTPNIGIVWGSSDNDISFNKTNMWLLNAAVLRRF
jgi:hypothetical protein